MSKSSKIYKYFIADIYIIKSHLLILYFVTFIGFPGVQFMHRVLKVMTLFHHDEKQKSDEPAK